MRRAPSSRGKDDALRYSVFDAAHQIGLSDPNALRWLEQNSNISEEDEEEELQRETRPPSDAHPPSLVFSASSHDSSIASPSNDHSTNYRAPYRPATKAPYQPYGHSQFQPNPASNGPLIFTQTQPEIRSPLGSNASSPRISPAQPPLQAGIKPFEQWPPTQLAIASLSPPSQPNSRAPSPGDKGNSKQAPEPKKSRKLTKAQRAEQEPEIITTSRKTSASGESGIGGVPTLPFLPFPAPTAGETLSSDASVSGLSAISGLSGSSSGTVTQSQYGNGSGSTLFPTGRASNEPRSFFEDDTDDLPASSSGHGHTQNSPSTSTANSAEPHHGKEKEGKLLRTMRSFKLSLKGQKAPKLPAPPVPAMPSQPPILTLKLDKDAMLKQELAQSPPKDASSQAKDREERVLKIAEMFTSELTRTTRSASETGTTLSQPLSELSQKGQSDLGHSKTDSELGHAAGSDLGHAPIRIAGASRGANKPAVARRRSVDELDAGVGEPIKVTERTRAGTVGTRSGHARTRSKSGDFTGIGWEKGDRPPVPDVRPVEVAKPEDTVKPTVIVDPKPAATAEVTSATKAVASKPATRFFVTNPTRPPKPVNKSAVKPVQPIQPVQPVQPAEPIQPVRPNPLSPNLTFDSETKHSLEREGFGARGERDESRALEVQHQLQSFVASMRGKEEEDDGTDSINDGFGRASGEGTGLGRTSEDIYGRRSEDSRRGLARVRAQGDDSDTLRSSGEYDPDPFRVRAPKSRLGVATNLPRPESEAIPHQFVIPANQLPKEVAPIKIAIPTKRTVPPVAYRSPEDELPKGLVRNSSISARPSVIINDEIGVSMAAEVAEVQTVKSATNERRSVASQESEFGLGYSGFDYAREEPAAGEPSASEEWVVPSPSWTPLEMKRAHSPNVGNGNLNPDVIPDSPLEPPIRPGQYLDVRPDRQRASGLSIPRSVTPDSPRPLLIPPRPTMSPFPNAPSPVSTSRSPTPLAPSRSTTPLAPSRSGTAPVLARSTTPQPPPPSGPLPSVPPPQARPTSPPQAWRPQLVQRNTPSPPIPRNTLPTRSSSISSMSSVEHSTRSPIARAAPARSVAAPSSRPSTASSVQSTTSRTMSLRSISTTPTPREREEVPRHEQPSRFLDPEAVPTAQKRGRVSPFPVKPLRERSASRDRLKESTEQLGQNQREKYPGGIDRLNGTDGFMQVPRVRFIGVRSSNGSSQAGWQGRMEDMNTAESPVQSDAGAWHEEQARPVSWQEYEEPTYLSYDDPEEYGQDSRYSAYEDTARDDDLPAPEAGPDVVAALSALRPSGHEQPAWAVDDTTPASRASTFTLASVYDDDDDIPPVPKTERLAAAVRGMGQNNWAAGRI